MENIVLQMQSNIKSVCVVGIPIGNDNELPAAVIIKNCNSSITEDDVHKYIAVKLSEAENLKGGIYFVNEFPLTPTGKIKRNELRKYAIEQYAMKNIS